MLRLTHQINSLKIIDVSLDRYVFKLDSPLTRLGKYTDTLDLTRFDHLTSLSVTLFDPPGYWGPGPRYTDGSISQRVAEILARHRRLRHASMEPIGGVESSADHPCFHPNYFEEEKLRALENIGPAHLPALEIFKLRGEFVLSDVAWAQWQHCDWNKMSLLVLREGFTRNEFLGRLRGVLTPENVVRLIPARCDGAAPSAPEEHGVKRRFSVILRQGGLLSRELGGFSKLIEGVARAYRVAPRVYRWLR